MVRTNVNGSVVMVEPISKFSHKVAVLNSDSFWVKIIEAPSMTDALNYVTNRACAKE